MEKYTTIFVIIYFLMINLVGFIMMGIDKSKAKKQQWRTKEKTIFLSAIIGGSLGIWIGMQYFRHKTKHNTFIFGIPIIFIIQVIIFLYMKINY
jgi:uncharacterized membrane protein YsdA (DUF1294 family)